MVRNYLKDKRVILLGSFLALFSLLLLASAVRDVSFRPGRHFSQTESEIVQIQVGQVIKSVLEIPLGTGIALLILIFLVGALVISLLTPEMRKRLLKLLFRLGVSIFVILYIFKLKPGLLDDLLSDMALAGGQPSFSSVDGDAPPVFVPPQIPNWLSFFIALGIILLSAIIAWQINRWWMRRNKILAVSRPLDEIAEVAKSSLHELSSGRGSDRDKIIQCYEDMSRVLAARRGLNREYAMTASEFAARLEKAGLPREPVNRLTHLFESVRYGLRTSAQNEVDEAIACLTSILKYCGEAV